MQLGKTKAVGAFNEHDGGIGDIYAYFHNRGGNEDLEFFFAELFHHRFFFIRFHTAMQQPQFEVREDGFLQQVMFINGSFYFLAAVLGLFDERIDDESLEAFFDLGTDHFIGAFTLQRMKHMCFNWLTACREFIHHRKVQITVEGEGQRARNGGGGHDQ
ncbi:hypothetical protein SDC9_166711 [bioreactor metagenome]|uniref:Uncharacterized protein n=1 Tax=bioreactor metagenome TaxID=1076179 RepID=A0A645G5Z1_9ZZZZ